MGMSVMVDKTPLTASKVKTLWTRWTDHVRQTAERQTADRDTKGVPMRG